MTNEVPIPRMGWPKGEAGASPALSRNCDPLNSGKPGRLPQFVVSTSLAARRWNLHKQRKQIPLPEQWEGFLFNRFHYPFTKKE